ncbi:helix-turn-helix domain-containing protein [Streptomyces sp. I05A-00742]|uniref:AraC-like ligand-binding domain-containing protein n=1 Tax=Streptomyces sp. I05A-00742 TaxID=2732853 RepID=UPI00148970F0|nr:helix-turn-helix domain-containing protein [Streptomyces sp. I05A-00742]
MLSETVFRSADVPPADRFDLWRKYIADSYVPLEIQAPGTEGFTATQRILELGAVRLWKVEHSPMSMRRTPALIRRSDPELYHLSLPLRGTMRVAQHGRARHEDRYGERDLVLLDTSRPYAMEAAADLSRDRISGTGLFVPRGLLPLPAARVERLLNRRLPGNEGIGELLIQFLTQVWDRAGACRPADGPRLGTVAVDLLSAVLAHMLDSHDPCTPESRRRTLVLHVKAHIRRHLADPALTPATIAEAHHISLSYLHRLFETEEATVAAWIRRRRLEHARHDLADPAQRTVPVHAVATRWGFSRAADFSRAFRAAYGLPPRDYRATALRDAILRDASFRGATFRDGGHAPGPGAHGRPRGRDA